MLIRQKRILKFHSKNKKNPHINPKNISKIVLSEESVKLCFVVTFNIISYIFLKNFIEIHEVCPKIWIFTSLISTIFLNFFNFTCYKKANNVSICKIISAVFWLGTVLDKLLKNCIKFAFKFINIGLVFLQQEGLGGGDIDPPIINCFQEAQP